MAYATSNPPQLLVPSMGGSQPALWVYTSADVHTDVDASGYISDAGNLGMKVGDVVLVIESDNSYAVTTHAVSAISSGAATLGGAVLA